MNHGKSVPQLEPWLRSTLTEIPAVPRAVIHALELAEEDLHRWAGELTDAELNLRPAALAPVAFYLRHIARSLDRLLSYAEGKALSAEQLALLKSELDPGAKRETLFAELDAAIKQSEARVLSFADADLNAERTVGAKRLPTTLGGLLVHVADHTQRHVGQAIISAKIVMAQRSATYESAPPPLEREWGT
jgi:uncharacterized damage-inducible protein DinB